MLSNIRDSPCPDSKDNLLRIAVCFYADALFKLYSSRKHYIPKLEPIFLIDQHIRRNFSLSVDHHVKSTYTFNKCGLYLTLFALLLSVDFKVSCEDFKNYMKFSPTTMKKYCDAIGARKSGVSYQLKFPIVRTVSDKNNFDKRGSLGKRK